MGVRKSMDIQSVAKFSYGEICLRDEYRSFKIIISNKPLQSDSGITFITYAQGQKIESLANLNGLTR